MSSMQLVILLIIFFAVLATVYIVMNALVPGAAAPTRRVVTGVALAANDQRADHLRSTL